MVRTVEQWKEILAPLDRRKRVERILGDVISYREGTSFFKDDVSQIAAAIDAIVFLDPSKEGGGD